MRNVKLQQNRPMLCCVEILRAHPYHAGLTAMM